MPKVRHVTSWMLHHPDDLDDDQRLQVKQARAACPHLDATAGHVVEFAKILTNRHGEQLDEWMAAVEADDLPPELMNRMTWNLKKFIGSDSDCYRSDRASYLDQLGVRLAESGLLEDALAASTEAVEIYRGLVGAGRHALLPEFARTLEIHGKSLSDLSR